MAVAKRIIFGIGIFFLFLLMVYLKVYLNARSEYQQGTKALQAKQYTQAITHFDRAIHWYSPGSAPVKHSIRSLWEIGTQAETRGDAPLALSAYQALRSGLYSARSFYTPHQEWIQKCDERIAMLQAHHEQARFPDQKIPLESRKEEALRILKMRTGPDTIWSIVCEIGFLGWIGATIGFIFFAFRGEKKFNPKPALLWGGVLIIFYAVWIIGMLKA